MKISDIDTYMHYARLSALGDAARAVASAEFDTDSEVERVVIVVMRPGVDHCTPPVDVTFEGGHGHHVGGLSL